MSEVIGMMEGAFFVSRGELIQWINKTFELNVTKIEQLGTGSVYCQILDSIHPGKINMSKVNWKARLEWEFINNLKLLQQSFLKCGLSKYIEIEKLSKGKYQDNLEFAQWMKRFYDLNNGGKEYDAVGRRGNVEPDFSFADKTPTVHLNNHKVEKAEGGIKSFSKGKNKELRSLSPSMKYNNKASNLLGKKLSPSNRNKELEDELKRLYKNLKDMKALASDEKSNNNEKIELLNELIDSSLQSKFFKKETITEIAEQ